MLFKRNGKLLVTPGGKLASNCPCPGAGGISVTFADVADCEDDDYCSWGANDPNKTWNNFSLLYKAGNICAYEETWEDEPGGHWWKVHVWYYYGGAHAGKLVIDLLRSYSVGAAYCIAYSSPTYIDTSPNANKYSVANCGDFDTPWFPYWVIGYDGTATWSLS